MSQDREPHRVALVTGGGRGIGRAITHELVGCGFTTVAVGRTEAALADTVAGAGGQCVAFPADLATTGGVESVAAYMTSRHDRLDVLVNNAGVAHLGEISVLSPAAIDEQLSLNLAAMLKLTGALTGLLTAAGSAHVINISSEQALTPAPGRSVYGATKAAVNYATRALAAELATAGIRVNAILPGAVDTAMLRAASDGAGVSTPLGGMLRPQDIAAWVSFLIKAGNVTGAMITVDAGASLGSADRSDRRLRTARIGD